MIFDGSTATGNDRAELFSAFFDQTYTQGNIHAAQSPVFTPRLIADIQSFPLTDVLTVLRMLKNLDGSKGARPDGVPPILFKMTAGNVATPLSKRNTIV